MPSGPCGQFPTQTLPLSPFPESFLDRRVHIVALECPLPYTVTCVFLLTRTRVPPPTPRALLTELPMAFPKLPGVSVAVGVTGVVGQGHVLEAVVWRRGVGQPIAGAVALGGAQGARPFAEGVRVQRVAV